MALSPATDETCDLGQGTYLSVYIDALIMCQALLIYELCMYELIQAPQQCYEVVSIIALDD